MLWPGWSKQTTGDGPGPILNRMHKYVVSTTLSLVAGDLLQHHQSRIPFRRPALNKINFNGDHQNVWNGRNSTYVTNFEDSKGIIRTSPVSTFFENNKKSVGAIVTHTQWGDQMFLGYAFFDPSLAGINTGYYDQARALMMMHEAIDLAGFGDDKFGGSKQLTGILLDNCFAAIKQNLGGLTQ